MPSCVFRKCKNYFSKVEKTEIVSYHTFPSDELKKHEWIRIVRAERSEHDWFPAERSTMCSAHFRKEDLYTTGKGYVRLKKTAVPVVQSEVAVRTASPNSLDNVDISDMDSVFDSPIEAALKDRVRKLTVQNEELQKKNKILRNENKRLKKKIIYMKNIDKC